MKPIQLDKQYKTRDGREVKIHAIDGPKDNYPVVASVRDADKALWSACTFTKEGVFCLKNCHKLDLIEVVPIWEGEIWIDNQGNVREGSMFTGADGYGWRKIKVKQEDPT